MWGNTSKETSPDGKGRNGALRALSLLGSNLSDLQDQTLLDHREDHELAHTPYFLYCKKANTLSRYSRWIPDFYEDGRMYPQLKVAARDRPGSTVIRTHRALISTGPTSFAGA